MSWSFQVNATRTHPWLVNIGSGNNMVPSGNKPFPEPMLSQMSPYSVPIPLWVNISYGSHVLNLLISLVWRHDGRDGVSNHQLHDGLLNRLFRRRLKKTSKLRVIGLCAVTGEFPHKGPVTRKCFHLMTSSCHIFQHYFSSSPEQ